MPPSLAAKHADPGSLMTTYRAALTAGAQASKLESNSEECQVSEPTFSLCQHILLVSLARVVGAASVDAVFLSLDVT